MVETVGVAVAAGEPSACLHCCCVPSRPLSAGLHYAGQMLQSFYPVPSHLPSPAARPVWALTTMNTSVNPPLKAATRRRKGWNDGCSVYLTPPLDGAGAAQHKRQLCRHRTRGQNSGNKLQNLQMHIAHHIIPFCLYFWRSAFRVYLYPCWWARVRSALG